MPMLNPVLVLWCLQVSAAVADPSRHTFDAEDLWKRMIFQATEDFALTKERPLVQFSLASGREGE